MSQQRCDYCDKAPDGPGIITVAKPNGDEAFKGCIDCLIDACAMFVNEANKCHCPLFGGCVCGVMDRERAARRAVLAVV